MIPHLIKPPSSSSGPLTYNEIKVLTGEAEIIAVRNIEGATMFSIRVAMEQLESNPLIRSNVMNKGFHLAANPSETDNKDEAIIIKYIDEVMAGLGYKNQPYVIFKHHDIDRVHYHVVSTRVLLNGHLIDNSFSHPKLLRLNKELSIKYGFADVCDKKEAKRLEPVPMQKGMQNKLQQIKANVYAAVMSTHFGEIQLKAVLRYYGILLERGVSKKGLPFESFRAVDEHGKYIGPPIPVKEVLGESFKNYYQRKYLEYNTHHSKHEAITQIGIAYVKSRNEKIDDFRKRLSKRGISLYLSDKNGNEAKIKTDIENVVFFDQSTRVCLSLEDCRLKINDILRLIRESNASKKKTLSDNPDENKVIKIR